MTAEEIKETYSMRDILAKCGLPQPNRAGFIQCPFHKEKTASMKIYDHDYNCFGCGANGDIFTFLQEFYHISFKEAFRMLGGSYAKPSFSTNLAIYKVQQQKKMKEKAAERLRLKKKLNNDLIDIYRKQLEKSEPLSDVWCDCYNALQLELYHHEILNGGLELKNETTNKV